MFCDEKIISALEFAENCIKLVTSDEEEFLKIREYYRENKFFIEALESSTKEMPEYIVAEAYEYFRFGCRQKNIKFYKDHENSKIEITGQESINLCINKLFKCKGVLNGEPVYLSKHAYDVLLLTKEQSSYNSAKNDSFMLRCYHKVVEYILKTLNVAQVPPLKEAVLNSYVDMVFPPKEYSNSNFSTNKKEALIFLFEKTR